MIYTIGEAFIDFIPKEKGIGLKDVTSFYKAPGGAPANTACAAARLGARSAFIGKVGSDPFGSFLLQALKDSGVDIRRVRTTQDAPTALAFVSLKSDGNRDFLFYRSPSADMLLSPVEISGDWFKQGDLLHFCSVDLIEAPVKYAHRKAIDCVKAAGGVISFDPNVRLPLWQDPAVCRSTILEFLPMADLVKISDEELEFVTGASDAASGVLALFQGDVKAVVLTKGTQGAEWITKQYRASVPGLSVAVSDTTGAGDAFMGAVLYLLDRDAVSLQDIEQKDAQFILDFANRAAALSVTRPGAIESLPSLEEVLQFK